MNKNKRQASLDTFFSKRTKVSEEKHQIDENSGHSLQSDDSRLPPIVSQESEPTSTTFDGTGNSHDIANAITKSGKLNADTRRLFLSNVWVPEPNFKFPVSGKRNLKFQRHWLSRWNWLTYSQIEDGAFCKYCVLFSLNGAGVGHQPLGKLVKTKFSNWKDSIEEFNKHEQTEYHKRCVVRAAEFERVVTEKQQPIDIQIDFGLKKQVEENRKKIVPIIDTIIMCGRQGLPLRGHRDHGPIELGDEPVENDGNFRALLRFRAKSGDKDLETHLLSASQNAMYISPQTQNEIIQACNEVILNNLVCRVNNARCFTICADETTDVAGIEQMSLCIRYIDNEKIREDFLQFVPVVDTTGRGLAFKILETLKAIGVNLEYLRGQGYDGASAMSGQFNGVQAAIKEVYPLALYMHCSSHVLNLAITDACSTQGIRNCMGTVGNICTFFRFPKRLDVLKESIQKMVPESNKTRLKSLCHTRWVERHDSICVFLEIFDAVVDGLESISDWADRDTSSNAKQLLCALQNSEFLISLEILNKVFSLSAPLSRFFQDDELDIVSALDYAAIVEERLDALRTNAEKEFHKLYLKANEKAYLFDTQLTKPRLAKRQTKRCNVNVIDTETYFRISIYVPFLDNFLTELRDRFTAHRSVLKSFTCLLLKENQSIPTDENEEGLKELIKLYQIDVGCSEAAALGELSIWYSFLQSKKKPKGALEALLMCDMKKLPAIHGLLKILSTIPVTTASNERSFSTLKRLKSYLRNTTSENRLNGLALLNIHRDVKITAEDVLKNFCTKPRRLEFRV